MCLRVYIPGKPKSPTKYEALNGKYYNFRAANQLVEECYLVQKHQSLDFWSHKTAINV